PAGSRWRRSSACSPRARLAAALVALSLSGCGARSDLEVTPPGLSGTYTRCAQGAHGAPGFQDVAGFQKGASLALAQRGRAVTVRYLDADGPALSLHFAATSGTSATLVSEGLTVPGFVGVCAVAPGDSYTFPGSLSAAAGALTSGEGTVFVDLSGVVV